MAATGLRLWDRLILFLAWTVTCGLVYLLGFYVGKGMQAQRLDTEERVVRLPVTGGAAGRGQRPKSDLTFYDKLAKSADRPASPTPEPAPPAEGADGHAAAARRGRRRPCPRRRRPTTTPAAPRPTTTLPRRARRRRLPPRAGWRRRADRRGARRADAPPSRAAARRAAAGGGRGRGRCRRRPRAAARTPTRSSVASAAAATTRAIVEVPRDGATWYRIRVGRYATAGQATEAMQRLRDQEGVSHVFVASE